MLYIYLSVLQLSHEVALSLNVIDVSSVFIIKSQVTTPFYSWILLLYYIHSVSAEYRKNLINLLCIVLTQSPPKNHQF